MLENVGLFRFSPAYYNTQRKDSAKYKRLKQLVLDLPHITPTKISDLKKVSVAVAEAYAGMTPMTISRDLAVLVDMNLVIIDQKERTLRPNTEIVLAFLPKRFSPQDNA